jgi:hypothetical protein
MTRPNVRDEALQNTTALPNGADHVHSAGFDLGISAKNELSPPVELLVEAPALVFADLGDAATMKYEVFHDTASTFASETSLGIVLTQTGAGGVGAAAATGRLRLPSDVKRHVRVTATNSAAGDASDKSKVCSLVPCP